MAPPVRTFLPLFGLLGACASASPPSKPASDPSPVAVEPVSVAPEMAEAETLSATVAVDAPEPALSPAPPEPPPPPPKATLPLKVLILGDSMAATDFGRALEDVLRSDPRITTARRGKSSTGLARPDFFDWMAEGPRQVQRHEPQLVLVILGGNDGQDLIPRKGGARVHWGSKAWPAAYAERLRTLTKRLGAGPRRVVFLGLPLMERPRLEKKLKLIRRLQAEVFAEQPGTDYVDTRSCFVSSSGKLLVEVEVEGWKKPQRLRQEDGIHLTVPGARHFASCVGALIRPILDQTPAQSEPLTTSRRPSTREAAAARAARSSPARTKRTDCARSSDCAS